MTLDLLRWGGDRLRVGPWRGDAATAYIAPLPEGSPPTVDAVRRCCQVLADRGYRHVITAALGPAEAQGFILAGFEVRERLHLLAHNLLEIASPTAPSRRARRSDRPPSLAIDARAFDPFWRLDDAGLSEAMSATPHSRFRVAESAGILAGYAVSGRAGRRGFLQRLAVDPDFQHRGIGSSLVQDALRWMKHRGVDRAVVNTQEQNETALRLYEQLGFRRQPGGLAVLQSPLP